MSTPPNRIPHDATSIAELRAYAREAFTSGKEPGWFYGGVLALCDEWSMAAPDRDALVDLKERHRSLRLVTRHLRAELAAARRLLEDASSASPPPDDFRNRPSLANSNSLVSPPEPDHVK